jgi:release factor glutamine methyltransferase
MSLPDSVFLSDVVQHAAKRFAEVGIDSAQVDAELLAGHVLGLSRGGVQSAIISGQQLSETENETINNFYARRLKREPLQHITGIAYFRNLELQVGRGVFIPRPETEFVAQLAIDALRSYANQSPIGVDLGTGSGAIALAMATEVSNSKIFAVEKSIEAIEFTQRNFETYAQANGLLVQGDLKDAFAELNDLVSVVASNPPYIPQDAVPKDIEVKLHDPDLALYGGEDGMQVMHFVSATAMRLLHTGGTLVVEHADSQANQVCQLLLADGWRQVRSHKDLTGRDRAVTAIK